MLNLSELVRIYVCAQPTDMRKGFDSLAAVVRDWLGGDPLSGHLFVFRSRRGDRVKLLVWDKDGLAIFYKKFESQYPHFLLFTETGRYANNLPCRLATAFGMDSHTPEIGPRRRPMSGEIAIIIPPRAKFAADP